MRLDYMSDMMTDEFDAYFARAQSTEKDLPQINYGKRGSNPDVNRSVDGPGLRRAKSCKSNYRRRGSTKGTPTRDLPTQVRADIDSDTEEAGNCAGLSDSYNESKIKESYRLLEVQCGSESHSRNPSWKTSGYSRGRSGSATPALSASQELPTELDDLSLEVPADNHLALPPPHTARKHHRNSKEMTGSPALIRRKKRFDKTRKTGRSKSIGTAAMGIEICDSPVENSDGTDDDGPGGAQGITMHLIGDYGVGKKSIVQQFKNRSLFSNPSIHEEVETHTTMISKIDGNHEKIKITVVPSEMHHTSFGEADVYVIVYSIVDRSTFSHAIDILHEIRRDQSKYSTVMLVANKGDLVRSRQVSEQEGKDAAKSYNCKCMEVSVVLNHRIGDVLNTSMKQLRHSHKKQVKDHKRSASIKESKGKGSPAAKPKRNFLGRLFRSKSFAASKSCDNLVAVS